MEEIDVYNSKGDYKGSFDKSHVIGNEVLKGIDNNDAKFRASFINNFLKTKGIKKVSTDSIRYMLDTIRDAESLTHLSNDKIADISRYIETNEDVIKEDIIPRETNLEDYNLTDFHNEEIANNVYFSERLKRIPREREENNEDDNCTWQVVSRKVRKNILIFPPKYKKFPSPKSKKIIKASTFEYSLEILKSFKYNLSSNLTLEKLGLDSNLDLSIEANEKKLKKKILEIHNVIIVYTIPVELEWVMQYQFDIEEKWGMNKECKKTYVPKFTKYKVMGKKYIYSSSYTFVHIEYTHSEKYGTISREKIEELAKDYTLEKLKGIAWFRGMPIPEDLPGPIDE